MRHEYQLTGSYSTIRCIAQIFEQIRVRIGRTGRDLGALQTMALPRACSQGGLRPRCDARGQLRTRHWTSSLASECVRGGRGVWALAEFTGGLALHNQQPTAVTLAPESSAFLCVALPAEELLLPLAQGVQGAVQPAASADRDISCLPT